MISKKSELIRSLQALHLPSLNTVIRQVKGMDFRKEHDLNRILTILISQKVLLMHPRIMDRTYKPSRQLRSFCMHQVGRIRVK